jgi:hypothetical protein
MGGLIVFMVLALPHGIGGLIDIAWRRRGGVLNVESGDG